MPISRWLWMLILLPLVLLSGRSDAGLVSRPAKTCGTTTYVAEVAAGCLTIKNTEVDADLNAIITGGVNNIETANINVAGLGTAAIADSAITSAKILNGTVATADLATGAAVNSGSTVAVTTGLTFTTLETTLASLPAITTRGGRVVLGGVWGLRFNNNVAAPTTVTLTIRVKRDGVTFQTTVMIWHSEQVMDVPVACPYVVDTGAAAGAHTYTVTGQLSSISGAGQMITPPSNAGDVSVFELA